MDNQQFPAPQPGPTQPATPPQPSQNPLPAYPMAAPDVPPTQPVRPERRRRLVFISLIVVLVVAGGAAYMLTNRKSLPVEPDNSASLIKPPAKAASSVTPLGGKARGSSDTANLTLSVEQIIIQPQTEGDAPDPGMKYIEVDASVTNGGKKAATLPGTFAYQTADGNYLFTADTAGKPGDPAKDVQVPGKQTVDDLSVDPGRTGDFYLLYQVPANDTGSGRLVWFDGYYDTKSTKLAVFSLT